MHLFSYSRKTRTPADFVDSLRWPEHRAHNATWAIFVRSQPGSLSWGNLGSELFWYGNIGLLPYSYYLDDGMRALIHKERIVWKIMSSVGMSRRARFIDESEPEPPESEPRPSRSAGGA